MYKSLPERLENDILSDNTHIERAKQCKNCALRDNGDVWSNEYTKAFCQIYPYPVSNKPGEVMDNTGECEFRVEEV